MFLSLALFVSFVTFFAFMTFLYLSIDEESKTQKALAVAFGMVMFALMMVAFGIISPLISPLID